MNNIKIIEFEAVGLRDQIKSKWVDPFYRVESFINLFFKEVQFNKIIVCKFNSKYLRNWKKLGLRKEDRLRILEDLIEAVSLKSEIEKSCVSHGHMSIIFVSPSISFFEEFIKLNLYIQIGEIEINGDSKPGPIPKEYIPSFLNCLRSNIAKGSNAFLFSHDANYLYQVLL